MAKTFYDTGEGSKGSKDEKTGKLHQNETLLDVPCIDQDCTRVVLKFEVLSGQIPGIGHAACCVGFWGLAPRHHQSFIPACNDPTSA